VNRLGQSISFSKRVMWEGEAVPAKTSRSQTTTQSTYVRFPVREGENPTLQSSKKEKDGEAGCQSCQELHTTQRLEMASNFTRRRGTDKEKRRKRGEGNGGRGVYRSRGPQDALWQKWLGERIHSGGGGGKDQFGGSPK